MPADVKLILFKLCERELPKPVLEALEETNDHLLKAGVLPHLRVLSTRATARAPAPAPREAYREPEPAPRDAMRPGARDRKRGVEGKGVSVSVDLGGVRFN